MTENWIKGGAAKWNEEAEEENKASVVVVREEYEKRMANMEEQHKLELEKIKNEKEEAITKYNELLKSQALGDLEESKEKDDNKDSKNEENQQSSKTKAKLSKKTDK